MDLTSLYIAVIAVPVVGIGLYCYLRWVWFYRDPVRVPNPAPGEILSPVDGTVVYVRPIEQGMVWSEKLGKRIPLPEITKDENFPTGGWIIGIYMSPLDVHYVYSPVEGIVSNLTHFQADCNFPMVDLWEYVRLTYFRKAVDLLAKRHHLENERLTVKISWAHGCLWVVEIADKFVNKIRSYVRTGDPLKPGTKLSFISRGSQIDVLIPHENVDLRVSPGTRVYGALSVLGVLPPEEN